MTATPHSPTPHSPTPHRKAPHGRRPQGELRSSRAFARGPIARGLLTAALLAVGLLAGTGSARAADLAVGDRAPAFELRGTDGKTHALADYAGRTVVLAWFPRAFTSGCTIECRSLARSGAKLREYDFQYFMASVDALDENARFARSEQADFPLLSDPTKAVARAYGVLSPMGFASRVTFYIGPDGRITAIDREVKPASSAEDMLARVQALGVPRRAPAGPANAH